MKEIITLSVDFEIEYEEGKPDSREHVVNMVRDVFIGSVSGASIHVGSYSYKATDTRNTKPKG